MLIPLRVPSHNAPSRACRMTLIRFDGEAVGSGVVLECAILQPAEPSSRADPQRLFAILVHGVHDVAGQSVNRLEAGELAVFESYETAALRTDPDRAIPSRQYRQSSIVGQTVLARVGGEPAVLEPADAS